MRYRNPRDPEPLGEILLRPASSAPEVGNPPAE
jgi:hypothetical protein